MPKKSKSIKVTDRRQKKAWLRKPKVSKYKIEDTELNKITLIVCEGQTEKLYFESFPVLGLTVQAVDLGGQTKLKLIESTADIIKNSDTDYDAIWCVFDMDVKKGEKEFADFDNAIEKAKVQDPVYEVAYSNDSFELWFYLHYNYTEQQHHRKYYYEELSKKWNINYIKEGKKYKFCTGIYNLLKNDANASQEEAIKRADKLYEEQKDLAYHKQNPISQVYKLVRFLNENLRA